MANQAIALGVRAPQAPNLAGAMSQMVQMRNMMMQQKAAERQAAVAQQTMGIQAAQEERAAALAKPAMEKASAEAGSARVKYAMDFLGASATALANARDPQQAAALGTRLKSMFPEPEFRQSVDETLASIPADPSQFGTWRETALMHTLDAKDQLAKEFTTQNLGTSTRVIATPKYGTGEARVVPGSEAAVSYKPTVINVEDVGAMVVDPNTGMAYPAAVGATGGIPGQRSPAPGAAVGGGGGGAAAALQTNPGAIKDGAFARSQPGYTGSSGGFATFNTPQAGISAQENLLRNSYISKGFNTVDKIVNKYAPQGPENSAASVANYKRYIASRAGIDINAPITPAQIPAVAAAMREFETGNRPGGAAGGQAQTTQQMTDTEQRRKSARDFFNITGINPQTGKDPIESLIRSSTSGAVEQAGAWLAGAIPESVGGGATTGMKNIGELGVLKSTLMQALMPGGRLSTGVSDEDRRAIEKMIGNIDDPSIPSGQRLAAWRRVKSIMSNKLGVTMPAPQRGNGNRTPTKGAKAPASSGWGTASVVGD